MFDVEAAKKAGYSDQEVMEHLASQRGFDLPGAIKSGYSPADIMGHLVSSAPAQNTPQEPAPPIADAGPNRAGLQYNQPGYRQMISPAQPKQERGPYQIPFIPKMSDLVTGIYGGVKKAVTLSGEVLKGEVDPLSEEGQRRVTDAATFMTTAGAASRAGQLAKGVRKAPKKSTPTLDQLNTATTKAYKEVKDLNVKYNSSAVHKMADDIEQALNEKVLHNQLDGVKDIHSTLQIIKNGEPGSYVLGEALEGFRRTISGMMKSPVTNVQRAARIATDKLDDFIASADPKNLANKATPGDGSLVPKGYNFSAADAAANATRAKQASKKILEARGNAAAGFRAEGLEELRKIMKHRADSANSGMNFDNTVRQKLTSLLHNAGGKGVRGFSKAEVKAIENIIKGTNTKNAFGNMLGGGGGLGQTLATFIPPILAGQAGASPSMMAALTIPGALGAAAKTTSNVIARKEFDKLSAQIRSRSPLADSLKVPGPETLLSRIRRSHAAQEAKAKAPGAAMSNGSMADESLLSRDFKRMKRALGVK